MTAPRYPRTTALIGCGRWGRNIARTLSELGALKVVVDPAVEALTPFVEPLGAHVTGDLDAVLADPEITAVAIAAPAADHARLASAALMAGKHVFVEKPIALELSDAERLEREAKAAGRTLMVGHLLQYHPAFVRMLELIAEGRIGALRHVTSNRLNPGAVRTEENALWSMAPHDFSMVLALAGGREPDTVDSLAIRVIDPKTPDEFAVQMRFDAQLTALVRASWLSPFKEHKLVALGETGALVFEDTAADPARKLVLYADYIDRSGAAPAFRKSEGEPMDYPKTQPLHDELAWFLDCTAGQKTPRTGPDEAIRVLRLLTLASEGAV